MALEQSLQTKIIRYLKSKGCYAVKLQAGPGVPKGAPDILALYEGAWLALEVKASSRAKYQPGQKETIAKLNEWSLARVVHPQNWPTIKEELELWLK